MVTREAVFCKLSDHLDPPPPSLVVKGTSFFFISCLIRLENILTEKDCCLLKNYTNVNEMKIICFLPIVFRPNLLAYKTWAFTIKSHFDTFNCPLFYRSFEKLQFSFFSPEPLILVV